MNVEVGFRATDDSGNKTKSTMGELNVLSTLETCKHCIGYCCQRLFIFGVFSYEEVEKDL